MVVGGFELSGGNHAQPGVESPAVEPVEVLQGGVLHVLEPAPGTVLANQLGLVETVERFSQGVIVTVSLGPHRAHRLGHPAAHSGVLARQAVRDRHPEPLPILTPRHRRASRRPHRWATRPTRSTSPSFLHRSSSSLRCCDGPLNPGWQPRSVWCTSPCSCSPRRPQMAISRASRARSVRRDRDACHPTTYREKTSTMKAR